MYGMQFGLALTALASLGSGMVRGAETSAWEVRPAEVADDSIHVIAPAPWLRADPADSLYRAAREALGRGDNRAAAALFGQIGARFPKSGYAADALYWQAFALYRVGGESALREGLLALRKQQKKFPETATRGDAAALETRILGELARRGDGQAAAELAEIAKGAGVPNAPTPPMPPTPPTPPSPPSPPSSYSSSSSRSSSRSSSSSCTVSDDDMKVAALNALQQMDAAKARPILRKLLARRDPASACLRRKAVFLVAQQNEPGTEDILLESVRNDPEPEVRQQAVFWLSQVGTERAIVALDSILRSSKDPEIQDKAVFALSQHNSSKAQLALRSYAERPDIPDNIREKAIFWLGQNQTADNAAFLRSLYSKLKNDELRKKVLFSLSQMGGEENGRWLLGVARDGSEGLETRKQALFWAGQAGVSIGELARLYGSVSDPEMRRQLIFVYSQRDEPEALDKLIEIAKRDPSPELRKRALFWLGQSEDSRAVHALQDIIEQP